LSKDKRLERNGASMGPFVGHHSEDDTDAATASALAGFCLDWVEGTYEPRSERFCDLISEAILYCNPL